MTPHQYIKAEEQEKLRRQELSEAWHLPLSKGSNLLYKVLDSMAPFKLDPNDVPLIIKLVENPKYDIGLFVGAITLGVHDCVHVLLGRGLLLKDEAFVIGYHMGSTRKMKRWRRNLFMFVSKYLYPKGYRFGEEERFVFNMGVMAGSLCPTDLSKVDFSKLADYKISGIREKLGVDAKLLRHFYYIEKELFPKSAESQRLI